MTWICPPCMAATKPATLSSASFTKACSFPTVTIPSTLRCQRSFSATSAMDTLKRARTRSMAERTRCRLDLSDPGSGRWRVRRSTPTNMVTSWAHRRAPNVDVDLDVDVVVDEGLARVVYVYAYVYV